MQPKIRDIEAETDKVEENNFLNLLEISIEFGEEDKNKLFRWVRPLHLNDEDGNPDPRIAAHVREASVNVEQVLFEEVHSESFSQDMRGSFQPAVTSRPSFDSSVEHSSRPNFACTSTTVMKAQEERGPMMVVILEMMVGVLHIHNKVNIH